LYLKTEELGDIMSVSKIEVKIGDFSFSGEGDEKWLDSQLDKILEKASMIIALNPPVISTTNQSEQHQPADLSGNLSVTSKSLANFLKEKNATTVQNTKFLATAAWLEAKGKKRLITSDLKKLVSLD
jgi:hypothetical protein